MSTNDHRIIVPRPLDEASPLVYAARELAEHLSQITGRTPTITDHPQDATAGYTFHVGRSPRADQLVGTFDWDTLGDEGVRVLTVGNDVVLAGKTPRGTLYAVYEFLDRVLACRWLTPTCSVIPRRESLRLGGVDITHIPPLAYREAHFHVLDQQPVWCARNRLNGMTYNVDELRGDHWRTAGGFVHTFDALVPAEKHFADHPDYFSLIEGKRTGVRSQLCLTNPDVLELVIAGVEKWITENPKGNFVSVSQNDWGNWCTCPACKAIDDREGGPSGTMIHFVNAVAQRIGQRHPNVTVSTLAYTYTVNPPKTLRPLDNVTIMLCHMGGKDSHALDACEENQQFLKLVRDWGRISKQVWVWDYNTNFQRYFMPFPNIAPTMRDIPILTAAGVTGLFAQCDASPSKGYGTLGELHAYLIARQMWRPDIDADTEMRIFLDHYYGAAAGDVHAFIDLFHTVSRESGVKFDLYCPLDQPFTQPAVMEQAAAILHRAAQRVAGDALLSRRIAEARLPVEFVWFARELRYGVKDGRYAPLSHEDTLRARRFLTRAKANGAEGLREGGRSIDNDLAGLDGYDAVTLERGSIRLVVVPALGGRLLSLVDTRSGMEWMHAAGPGEADYPCAGGYEEYSQAHWRSAGWSEVYDCTTGPASIELSALLSDGLRIDRAYRILDGSRPTLEIISTITNSTNHSKNALLRPHPELRALDFSHDTVTANGITLHPWRDRPAERENGDWLTGDHRPAAAWSLCRADGSLEITFDPASVDKCLLSWNRATNIIGLELFGPPLLLHPRESFTLTQRWTLKP